MSIVTLTLRVLFRLPYVLLFEFRDLPVKPERIAKGGKT